MDKRRYENKTIQELNQELNLLDEMLIGLKKERARALEIKESKFNENHFDDYDNDKVMEEREIMLEEEKEYLNEELGINEIRKTTDTIKEIIREKQAVEDTEPMM